MNNKCDSYRGCSIEMKSKWLLVIKSGHLLLCTFNFHHTILFFLLLFLFFYFVHSLCLPVRLSQRSHDHSMPILSRSQHSWYGLSFSFGFAVRYFVCYHSNIIDFRFSFAMYFEVALCENVIGCPHYYKSPPRLFSQFNSILVYSRLERKSQGENYFPIFLTIQNGTRERE